MFSITLALMLHSLYLGLRLSGRGGAFPRRLTTEEETALWARHQQGDKSAQNALIEHNMRLVTHIARKFYASESDYEDLLSCGNIGLIKAVMTFDPGKGARFATYACRCIENAILT
ncbi:MAG: sigma-70 family RNA polymerase sigma factor [Oscillospiraceae bacterium]|nr:sigma-70 family RNA polymerase sigma factor [Oscillospiraceae bacterium]